jgi:hypothetical protein
MLLLILLLVAVMILMQVLNFAVMNDLHKMAIENRKRIIRLEQERNNCKEKKKSTVENGQMG